jgi:hypothetical protein
MDAIPGFQLPGAAALIAAGKLTISDPAMSEQFARFVEEKYSFLPVTGYSIDWSSVPGALRLNWNETVDESQATDFINETSLARHRFAGVWFGRSQPCVVGKYYNVAYNLGEILPPRLGVRYIFGVDGEAPAFTPTYADFVELADTWLSAPPLR